MGNTNNNNFGESENNIHWKVSTDNLPDKPPIEEVQRVVNRVFSLPLGSSSKPKVFASGAPPGSSKSVPYADENVIISEDFSYLGPPPDMPFQSHGKPSMKSMSNKFREKGPNKIMYPRKNGPIAKAKRLGISLLSIPAFDPDDEIFGNIELTKQISLKYANELSQLSLMSFNNHNKNLRYLYRLNGNITNIVDEYFQPSTFENIYIGDRVTRGPDWKWGDQDGGIGLEGTVRGLRQWHPNDNINEITEVIILWDHGLYGNYRFGYKSAYDIKVIDRNINIMDEKQQNNNNNLNPISVGETVIRSQPNWRWGIQDGGNDNIGTIIELYASPAPFEGGARIAVCWDHEKDIWFDKINKYKQWKDNEEKNNGGIFNDLTLNEYEYNIIQQQEQKNNNDDDVKEYDLLSNSTKQLNTEMEYQTIKLATCNNIIETVHVDDKESKRKRKEEIKQIGKKTNDKFIESKNELDKNIKTVQNMIDNNNKYSVDIDVLINEKRLNRILNKINNLGKIVNDEKEQVVAEQDDDDMKWDKMKQNMQSELSSMKEVENVILKGYPNHDYNDAQYKQHQKVVKAVAPLLIPKNCIPYTPSVNAGVKLTFDKLINMDCNAIAYTNHTEKNWIQATFNQQVSINTMQIASSGPSGHGWWGVVYLNDKGRQLQYKNMDGNWINIMPMKDFKLFEIRTIKFDVTIVTNAIRVYTDTRCYTAIGCWRFFE
eukprot:36029_1